MLETIFGALLPTAFTMLVGYLAARHRIFGPGDAAVLNRMVMSYALPLAIFVGMVRNSRAALLQDVVVLFALVGAIVGVYRVVYVFCRRLFRLSVGESALAALAASMPNTLFMGLPVLGYLYHEAGVLPPALGVALVLGGLRVPALVTDSLTVLGQATTAVSGKALDCGHLLPEERPAQVISELRQFFRV